MPVPPPAPTRDARGESPWRITASPCAASMLSTQSEIVPNIETLFSPKPIALRLCQTCRYAEISAPLGKIPRKRGIFDV